MRLLFLCIYFLVCLLYFFWLGSNEYESSQAKLFFTQTRFDHEPLNFIWSNKNEQQQTQKQDHSTAINCLFFSLSIATSSPKISPRIVFHISATHHMPKNSPKWNLVPLPQSVCLRKCCSYVIIRFFKLLLFFVFIFLLFLVISWDGCNSP